MLLIRLFSRTFVTHKSDADNKYSTMVIQEIPKYLNDRDIIEVQGEDYIDTNNIEGLNPSIKIKLVKLIKQKMQIIRSKRRQRCTRRMGYKKHIGYFQIIN